MASRRPLFNMEGWPLRSLPSILAKKHAAIKGSPPPTRPPARPPTHPPTHPPRGFLEVQIVGVGNRKFTGEEFPSTTLPVGEVVSPRDQWTRRIFFAQVLGSIKFVDG